jgi:ABC-2 type transport system permease protein
MRALGALTIANIRSYLRNRQAVFWTLMFPLIFIFLFGAIFTGGGNSSLKVGWVDDDRSLASGQLRTAFGLVPIIKLVDVAEGDALDQMRHGDVSAVFVVPQGYSDAATAAQSNPGSQATVTVYTDPSQTAARGTVLQVVNGVLAQVNLGGRPPAVAATSRDLQTQDLNAVSYLTPSILGMALMQLGVFSAISLVADREKLILKRLNATPLRRWQLVGSNILMRLLIGIVQTALIVGVGALVFNVKISGNVLGGAGFALVGALAFIALGYVIASFAKTEDAANGMVSAVQFPLMFLSGTFFPLDQMPDFLRVFARALPLTYLSDALRQTMVNGAALFPLWVCLAVLLGWSVVCFGIASRFFRWQ